MTLCETPQRESHGGRDMTAAKLHTPARVLVVEGDQATLMMLRFCLHSAGFQVTEAATGEEASRILDRVHMADPQPVNSR